MSADQLAQYIEYITTTSDADIMIFVKENNRKRTVQCNNLICNMVWTRRIKKVVKDLISFHMISIIGTKWFGTYKKDCRVWQFCLLMIRIHRKKDNPVQQCVTLQIIWFNRIRWRFAKGTFGCSDFFGQISWDILMGQCIAKRTVRMANGPDY